MAPRKIGIKGRLDEQERMMKEQGWIVHYVTIPPWVNCHTHGLPRRFHHPDLQLVSPLEMQKAMSILHLLVGKISSGRTFSPGEEVTEIIKRFPIRLMEAFDGDRKVLRIIFPDEQGSFDGPFARGQQEARFDDSRN